MKYNSKAKMYRGSNLSFDCSNGIGLSYDWYMITRKIEGKMIVNSYFYSPTTTRHYYKIKGLLTSIGCRIDYEIEAPKGLQDLDFAKNYYENLIKIEREAIAKPRARKEKNLERQGKIKAYEQKIKLIEELKG